MRCGLRGFGGYVVCCGNGPLWLLFHCFEKVRWGFLLVAQSISYAILIIILVEAQRYWQREDVVDLRSYFRKWRGNITVMAFIVLAVHSISIYTGKGGHYRRDWHPSSLYVAVSFISFIQNFAFFGFVISLFYPSEEEED
ncbi:MAG: hypothetical protein LBS87_01760 [Puniceicoccales bacterium]|nr:hypothetical protein [Puniceicoccales bacterium]